MSTGKSQESVWDYPRPPRLELSPRSVRVELAGVVIAETNKAYRVLETSHPPSWYLPPEDIQSNYLIAAVGQSFCEWKGVAQYWTVAAGGRKAEKAAWSYARPTREFAAIAGYLAFYPNRVDCYVDDERVQAQAGGFYGGWITGDIAGPFKGEPGTSGW